ncbi:hypothetical protein PTQ27_01625 [Mannheimia sp. AT1]|uniref:Uncharacterized protein n=1 Tax=Mannheimia cairinae TaxID=3025936 RepID=A0ABT5MM46_9PAST|nr:hypothetical protein [Mannheimia cairinae]MDD0823175.1 hypothetical protein [Mannheimia cairinae]MDD0825800.1 hypothetical protein [Mannheimia cairinae]
MSKTQAVKLILENLPMIEEMESFLYDELAPSLFNTLDNIIKDELQDWDGIFDFYENHTGFCPKNWMTDKLDKGLNYRNSIGRYHLGEIKENNHQWISNLFNINGGQMNFIFYGHWGNEQFKFTRGKWKNFCRNMNEKFLEIQQTGFKFDEKEGRWYLPIQPLDIQKVIECYENDLEDAMEPIYEACGTLLKAHPYFEKIMEEAKNYKE